MNRHISTHTSVYVSAPNSTHACVYKFFHISNHTIVFMTTLTFVYMTAHTSTNTNSIHMITHTSTHIFVHFLCTHISTHILTKT